MKILREWYTKFFAKVLQAFMVALPCGKQRYIHGPAVNVPSEVDSVCKINPRERLCVALCCYSLFVGQR